MRSPGIVKTAIWDDACKASGHCAEFVCGLRERHLHLFDGLFRNGIEAHNTLCPDRGLHIRIYMPQTAKPAGAC